jgi:DNA-binding transcriptional regulator YdaS (Cro superfamily)
VERSPSGTPHVADWLTDDDARQELARAVQQAGSAEKYAKAIGCSPSLVSLALSGSRPVGPRLAQRLGLIATAVKTWRYLKQA